MTYKTQYFGEIECDESELFYFPAGLPGFETEHSFLLIPFAESGGTMFSLQSTTTPALSFIAIDPFALLPDYEPELSESDLHQFGVDQWQALSYCVLCSYKESIAESTVNLRCPIVIQLDTRQGRQIIMDTARYGMRHPLAEFSQREEQSSC